MYIKNKNLKNAMHLLVAIQHLSPSHERPEFCRRMLQYLVANLVKSKERDSSSSGSVQPAGKTRGNRMEPMIGKRKGNDCKTPKDDGETLSH